MMAEQRNYPELAPNLPSVPADQLEVGTMARPEARHRVRQSIGACAQTDVYHHDELLCYAAGEIEIDQIPYADQQALSREVYRDKRVTQLDHVPGMVRVTFEHDKDQYSAYCREVRSIIDQLMTSMPEGSVVTMADFEKLAAERGVMPEDDTERERFGRIFMFSEQIVIDSDHDTMRLRRTSDLGMRHIGSSAVLADSTCTEGHLPAETSERKSSSPGRRARQSPLTQSLGATTLDKLMALRETLVAPSSKETTRSAVPRQDEKPAPVRHSAPSKKQRKINKRRGNLAAEARAQSNTTTEAPTPAPASPIPKPAPPSRKETAPVRDPQLSSHETLATVLYNGFEDYLASHKAPKARSEDHMFQRTLAFLTIEIPASQLTNYQSIFKELLAHSNRVSRYRETSVYATIPPDTEPEAVQATLEAIRGLDQSIEKTIDHFIAAGQSNIHRVEALKVGKSFCATPLTSTYRPPFLKLFEENPRAHRAGNTFHVFTDAQAKETWLSYMARDV